MDWKEGCRKPKEIKNGLRTSFYPLFFFGIRGERVENLSALNLPKHQRYIPPFVLSLSKYERALCLSSPYLPTSLLRQAQDERDWKTPSVVNLPNRRHHLSPLVLIYRNTSTASISVRAELVEV
ncbi:MAG: hypothetical protein LBD67_03040 [Candidatus Accumulibacter sp.]|jgi:hypothetical protein|nr:hypothetical protein [Accumulibacter sp.]